MRMAGSSPFQGGGNTDYAWRRACVACTKAKRQCSKQLPACRRCARKGASCKYLPARRAAAGPPDSGLGCNPVDWAAANHASEGQETSNITAPTDHNALASTTATTPTIADSIFPLFDLTEADMGALPLLLEDRGASPPCPTIATAVVRAKDNNATNTATTSTATAWFLAPETWIADHALPSDAPATVVLTCDDGHLQRWLEDVQQWHRQWAAEGQSPLHHARLYRHRRGGMPRCVQDAWTALAAFYGARAGTEAADLARRVLDDRVAQLLQEQALLAETTASLGCSPAARDPLAHLSRVHALLAYQVVRLLDGDIRSE